MEFRVQFLDGYCYQFDGIAPVWPTANDEIWEFDQVGGIHATVMTWNMASMQLGTFTDPEQAHTHPPEWNVLVFYNGRVHWFNLSSPVVDLPTEKHRERTVVVLDGATVRAVYMAANIDFILSK